VTEKPQPAAEATGWQVFWRSTWGPAWLGTLLLWASFPPLDLWPLAWLAPLPWLALVDRETLTGRPYRAIWLAGFGFWLLAIHWIRLPHPATYIGWAALAFYLAFYTPVFIGLSRVAVHRFRVPLPLAAAAVWTGLEFARAYILDGFGMVYLGHTQYRFAALIQISDLAGAYGVSFVVMAVAGCLWLAIRPASDKRPARRLVSLAAGAILLAATLGYGVARTAAVHTRPGPRIAIVQECIEQSLRVDAQNADDVINKHVALSREAARGNPDLIVWPETMWRYPLPVIEEGAVPPEGLSLEDLQKFRWWFQKKLKDTAHEVGRPLLLGIEFQVFATGKPRRYNSSVLVQPTGEFTGRYDKVHRVIFGEYIPLAEYFPWLYDVTPLAGGIAAGDPDQGPMKLGEFWVAPSICFESTVPHRIRRQMNAARAAGHEPDVLVNLTNDAWFWGSCQLDQHLACAVFRAVENRKPLLVSANTGLSAAISSDGRLNWVGPRWDKAVALIDVELDDRTSPYSHYGDWPAGLCLLFTGALAGAGLWQRKRGSQ
jgi:apolipoprotein N-acyltransferase